MRRLLVASLIVLVLPAWSAGRARADSPAFDDTSSQESMVLSNGY